MHTLACQRCKLYLTGRCFNLEPVSWATPENAEVFVLADEPTKKDIRAGRYLAEHASEMLESVLAPFVDFDKIYLDAAVQCYTEDRKVKAKTNEAKLCYGQFAGPRMQRYLSAPNHGPVLLLGFWPTKLCTGRDLKELHEKVMEIDGTKYGVVYSPNYFLVRNVRWWKDPDGTWQCTPGGFEKAANEWRQHALPVVDRLFGKKAAHVQSGIDPTFPYTRVTEPEEMVRRLEERAGKYVMGDLETEPTAAAIEKGWSALDWFYGPETCRVMSFGFSFFDTYADTTYLKGTRTLSYDPNKVCVYTGEFAGQAAVDIAKAMANTKVLTFNGSYDTGVVLQHSGVALDIHADVCDMAYVVNQSRKKYNLESLSYEYVPEFATWAGEIKKRGSHSTIPRPKLWHYNAGDCVNQSILFFTFMHLMHEMGASDMYWSMLAPVKTTLRDMEAHGCMVDHDTWLSIKTGLEEKLEHLRGMFSKLYPCRQFSAMHGGKPFNPNASEQVMWVLNRLYPNVFKDTRKDTLKKYVDDTGTECPFLNTLLAYRKIVKQHGTYIVGLKQRMKGSIVYPSFKVNTTETGRTSSGGGDTVGLGKTKQVNIQNIPRDGGMRTMFRARPNHYLLYGDYSQIEVRVAGAYANSPEIRDVCLSGLDFHGSMASRAFGVSYEDIMAEDDEIKKAKSGTSKRTASKTITFGILYGMSALRVAIALKLKTADGMPDVALAQQFIDDYFARMQAVKNFIDETHAFAEHNLYVRTVFGRIRRFDRWSGATRRESVNTLVQSAASDIFLMATVTVAEYLKRESLYKRGVYPWAEVHDNLTLEVHNSIPKEEILPVVNEAMTTGVLTRFPVVDKFMGDIPLAVDFGASTVWK